MPDPWRFETVPSLEQLASAEAASGQTAGRPTAGRVAAEKRLRLIDNLIGRCHALSEMDFAFLYDPARDLLSIGYNVSDRRRDPSYYDLLASEARLASFMLIAQDQVPQEHWFALGRQLTAQGGDVASSRGAARCSST